MSERIDTDAIRTVAIVWRHNGASATADAISGLCDEVDRLRNEVDHLTAALKDIADIDESQVISGYWFSFAECSSVLDPQCHVRDPDDPVEWCPVCVAEVAWCAWKMEQAA